MITKEFILAGKAIFTLEVPDSYRLSRTFCNRHYTFKVNYRKPNGTFDESWFIYLLTGPDNTRNYTYVGQLYPFNGELRLTDKSKYNDQTTPVILSRRVLARVWAGEQAAIEAAGFKLHHEGKCCRCGRKLTVPESIESGIGPECASRMAG